MEKIFLDLQNEIIAKLAGKFNLMQGEEEKKTLILDALSAACGNLESKMVMEKIKALETRDTREQFIKDFLSYGKIGPLLNDPDTEDILINSLNPIYIHTTSRGLVKTDFKFETSQELDIFIKKLIIFSGHSELAKINNLELPNIDGRVNIVFSAFGPHVTITKIKQIPMSIIDLISAGAMNYEMAAQIWLYMEGLSMRPTNIMISGGPGAGKTTLLNALLSFIPTNERLVVIEDTLELNTQLEENCARLECSDSLTLADLVKNSLRMRPDRIIVGEVRGKEAQDMITAMNIGKYCIATLHASTAREAILRLQSEPMNVPETLVGLIDVFIVMHKYQKGKTVQRVVSQIMETAGIQDKKVLLSHIWQYDSAEAEFEQVATSSIYRDNLAESAGLTSRQVMDEIAQRSRALKALKDKGFHTMKDVTRFCRLYNNDPKKAFTEFGL
ncbi:MAG: ATPase, T2SS/T4P/T4SS family [Candidatus Omnitrophica bacterium]|nr:ATPase, T2SS/T4P/T4SS family [Candidatus Omnitrophota bacterium]MDD5236628.1 ATPase, T2SS/T4P/T4SS family [Candidatus Omnitrophota bacterium]MDD5611129.1 ATPase, T2SS/T4P/T4SS family [Candidatus Omnitrophota bacterium]